MNRLYWLSLFVFCFAGSSSKGQLMLKALEVGDTVPSEIWKSLSVDSKNKLIILDFWSTTCGPCMAAFPKVEKLQQEFGKQLKIILVNSWENAKRVKERLRLINQRRKGNKDSLIILPEIPAIYGDTILSKIFPHSSVPHHVWLKGNGEVLAITHGYNMTSEHISTFLKHNKLSLMEKSDQKIDISKPLFSSEMLPLKKLQHYTVFLKGFQGGLGNGKIRKNGEVVYGRLIANSTILNMYKIIIKELLPEFTDKRMVLEVRDSLKLFYTDYHDDVWKMNNQFSYDKIVSLSKAPDLYKLMLKDLNDFSGYIGKIEKREVKCYGLIKTGNEDELKTSGKKPENELHRTSNPYLVNNSVAALVQRLNRVDYINIPVTDETGIKTNIDIQFKTLLTGMEELNNMLKTYGLQLIEQKKQIEMFVISEVEE